MVTLVVELPPSWTLIRAELPTLPIRNAPPPVSLRRVSVVEPELKPTVTAPLTRKVWPTPTVMRLSATALLLRSRRPPKVPPPFVRSRDDMTVEPATLPKVRRPELLNWPGAEEVTAPVLARVMAPMPLTTLVAGST